MNLPVFTQLSPKVLRPRLPAIGNIKIGGKGEKIRNFYKPIKFDHFKVTLRARDKDSKNFIVDEAIHQKIGPKPTFLNVRLLFNEPHQNFRSSLNAYEGMKCRCTGNGDVAYDRVLKREIPCTCPLLKQHQGDYPTDILRPTGVVCKPQGVLSVFLDAAETFGGFYVFRTTSWEIISSMHASLDMLKSTLGGLSFLPFRMMMYPATVRYEENGVEKHSTSYMVALVLNGSMDAAYQLAKSANEERERWLQLTAGASTYTPEEHIQNLDEIAREDEAEIAQEFYPESEGLTREAEFHFENDDEEDQPDPLEGMIRIAYELAKQTTLHTNKMLTEYDGRLAELAESIEKAKPELWKAAQDEYSTRQIAAREAAADADPEPLLPEPVPVDLQKDTFTQAVIPAAPPAAAAQPKGEALELFEV